MENFIHSIAGPVSKQPTLLERVDARLHAFMSIDAIPSVDPLEQDAVGLLFEIDQTLQAGTYGSRFSKTISDRFQHDSKKARGDFYVRVSIVATLIYNLFLFADAIIVPDVIWLAIVLQLGVGTPVAIVGIWLVWVHRFDVTVPTIIAGTVMILTTVALFSLSRSPYILLLAGTFPLYLVAMNVGQALPFKPALGVTIVFCAIFTTAIFMHPSLEKTVQIFSVVTLISTAHYSLIGNYRIEASVRRAYLYALKASLRSHILARTNSELETMVHVDGLTGIGNRRHFDETIQRIWREARTNVAILLIDIDFFKKLNDTYGHQTGDLYLRGVAQALVSAMDNAGTLARYGGEEFVAILPDSSKDAALTVAERLRRSVEALTLRFDEAHDIRTTISIGCAVCTPSFDISAYNVVAAADAALYQAKASGRNRMQMFSGSFSIAA